MATCNSCGEILVGQDGFCGKCGAKTNAAGALVDSVVSSASGSLLVRYRDAYRVSAVIIGMGNTLKIIGFIIAGLIVLGGLSESNSMFGGGLMLPTLILAVIAGGIFWVMGVHVTAQGQILRATLDGAVNSSPLLTNTDRISIMSL